MTTKSINLGVTVANGKPVYATQSGLKFRNSRETSPADFVSKLSKSERRVVRKALDRHGLHGMAHASVTHG